MIRRVDAALRSELAAAPLDRSMALFEAAVMARCAASPTQNSGRLARHQRLSVVGEPQRGGVLIEFASSAAARRYLLAITTLVPEAEIRDRRLGCRHQYDLHQVTVPARLEPMVENRLRRAWQGGTELLMTDRRLMNAPRRQAVARAVWRSALLVIGTGRGVGCVRLRVADLRVMELLLLSAAALGLPAQAQRRPGGYVVTVEGVDAVRQLLDEVGSGMGESPAVPTSA